MSHNTIYLDNAATTPVSKVVADIALKYYTDDFYNPSALYKKAFDIVNDIKQAADIIGEIFKSSGSDIVFTSGATESNNYALECGYKNKKGNLIISGGEHASVYEKAMQIKSIGREVRIVPLMPDGRVDTEKLVAAVDENSAFVSVIHVSNETGAVNDIAAICKQVKQKNCRVVFHSDGVQAALKSSINLPQAGIDLYSISAHKLGGLKGVGALYIKNGFNMKPFITGGGQQNNRRSGTENVGGVVSFAAAVREFKNKSFETDIRALRNYMISEVKAKADWAIINGSRTSNTGYILSISFPGIKGEVLARRLEEKNILIGLGSACSTHIKQSRVLSGMGLTPKQIDGTVRISFSPANTLEEIKYITEELILAAVQLKGIIDG